MRFRSWPPTLQSQILKEELVPGSGSIRCVELKAQRMGVCASTFSCKHASSCCDHYCSVQPHASFLSHASASSKQGLHFFLFACQNSTLLPSSMHTLRRTSASIISLILTCSSLDFASSRPSSALRRNSFPIHPQHSNH